MISTEFLEVMKQFAEVVKAALEICLNLIKLYLQFQKENQWVLPDDATALLGSGISAEMLKERCADGRFKHGKHFINTSDGKRGNYLVKVSAVRQYFETEPAKRSPTRRGS